MKRSFAALAGLAASLALAAPAAAAPALTVTGVPDGTPTQPYNDPPYCVGNNGSAGDIVAVGAEVQFEGDGTYSVKVSVGANLDCVTAGRSSTRSFSVPTRVAPSVVGQPLVVRAKPLAGNPFEAISEEDFPRPGAWTCLTRGVVEGIDENFDTAIFGTPWSSPLALAVRSDFRRRLGKLSKPGSKRPRYTIRADFPGASQGGRAKVTVYRVKGGKGKRFKLRKFGTSRGTFGVKNVQLRLRRPRAAGYCLGRVAFSGTSFVRGTVDPVPVLLLVEGRRPAFASVQEFPFCSQ